MNLILKICSLAIALLCFACTSENTGEAREVALETTTTEEATSYDIEEIPEASTEKVEVVEPPRDVEEVKIIDEQTKNSPFFKLGCCETEDQRKRTCCCEKVVEKYKEIRASGNTDLVLKIKTEDPLFSGCKRRSKWRKAIEAIEQPPASEEEEELDF